MQARSDVLSWLHIGDLHLTEPGLANHRDLQRIVALIQTLVPGSVDFVLLPGDNADDGTPAQFALARDALAGLPIPLHILPGDHDFKPRNLDAFYDVLGAERLPHASVIRGHRCLFLDVVSAGTGGPDFRLAASQLNWLDRELAEAEAAGQRAAVFMHTYPADLREGADRLAAALARPVVVSVDMGHTHYNELANDGRTIFMTTRSTGQIEEGPPGFSVAAIDGGAVSWRFHPIDQGWPLVLVTNPADHRLLTAPDPRAAGEAQVAAKVLANRAIQTVRATVDGRDPIDLAPDPRGPALWAAALPALDDGLHDLTVTAEDSGGNGASDTIRFLVDRAGSYQPPRRHADGSDRDAIGAWPEKHLLGTQLGPNRNGRKW